MTPESDAPHPRSWRRATVIACALSAMLAAVAFLSSRTDSLRIKRIDVPAEIGQCATDSDCVLVNRIGCCPCQSGGARWAINKDAGDTLRRFLKRACRHAAVCTRVYTCRDDVLPSCAGGHCIARTADG
jgi:hypothetical protein